MGESVLNCIVQALGNKKVLVNLVNLINHRNLPGVEIIRFRNWGAFKAYTDPKRIFPKEKAKEEGFIKALLRRIW